MVSSETRRTEYTLVADDEQDIPVGFYFIEDTDLKVYLNGDLLTLTTDYTLTGAGSEAADGVVDLESAAGAEIGDSLVVVLDPAKTQSADFPPTGAIPSASFEQGLDRLSQVTLALQGQIDRCVKIPVSDTGSPTVEVDDAATRANKVLRFDADGDIEAVEDIFNPDTITPSDGVIIVGDGTGWVGESGATARASLGVTVGTDVQAHSDILDDIAALTPSDGGFVVGNGSTFVVESGATARTSLGLVIGTDVQAYDAELAALAGVTSAADKVPYFTGAGAASTADFTAAARTLAACVDASAQRSALGLVIGTDVQAYSAKLADIAALAVTDGNIIVGDGTTWVAESGATARTSLGLGSIATQDSTNVSITGGSVTGLSELRSAYLVTTSVDTGSASSADLYVYAWNSRNVYLGYYGRTNAVISGVTHEFRGAVITYDSNCKFVTGYRTDAVTILSDWPTTAPSGAYATTVGYKSRTGENYASAFGDRCVASGDSSFAGGSQNTASGGYSTALGLLNTASGTKSLAVGAESTASGNYSIAMGYTATASGASSTAIGKFAKTTVANTVEMGYWSDASTRGASIRINSGVCLTPFAVGEGGDPPTDGGATAGAEVIGSIPRGMIEFGVSGVEDTPGVYIYSLVAYYNVAGTVMTVYVGQFS
jgi:hypothetical protein